MDTDCSNYFQHSIALIWRLQLWEEYSKNRGQMENCLTRHRQTNSFYKCSCPYLHMSFTYCIFCEVCELWPLSSLQEIVERKLGPLLYWCQRSQQDQIWLPALCSVSEYLFNGVKFSTSAKQNPHSCVKGCQAWHFGSTVINKCIHMSSHGKVKGRHCSPHF